MPLVVNVGRRRSRMTQSPTAPAVHDGASRIGDALPPMTATNEARKIREHRSETIRRMWFFRERDGFLTRSQAFSPDSPWLGVRCVRG